MGPVGIEPTTLRLRVRARRPAAHGCTPSLPRSPVQALGVRGKIRTAGLRLAEDDERDSGHPAKLRLCIIRAATQASSVTFSNSVRTSAAAAPYRRSRYSPTTPWPNSAIFAAICQTPMAIRDSPRRFVAPSRIAGSWRLGDTLAGTSRLRPCDAPGPTPVYPSSSASDHDDKFLERARRLHVEFWRRAPGHPVPPEPVWRPRFRARKMGSCSVGQPSLSRHSPDDRWEAIEERLPSLLFRGRARVRLGLHDVGALGGSLTATGSSEEKQSEMAGRDPPSAG
jgi:hypothetical protein